MRETETARVGEGQLEREREDPKQALHCQHRGRYGARPHEAMRSWPEPKSDAELTEPPRRPSPVFLKSLVISGRTVAWRGFECRRTGQEVAGQVRCYWAGIFLQRLHDIAPLHSRIFSTDMYWSPIMSGGGRESSRVCRWVCPEEGVTFKYDLKTWHFNNGKW